MKPTQCDINFQKLFFMLFNKVNSLQNVTKRINSYVNLYFQLITVFPELEKFLSNSFNRENKILNSIHTLSDPFIKEKYYKLYTKNYSKLNEIKQED